MPKPLKSQWEFGELFPAEAVRKTLTVSELTGSIRRVIEKNVGSVSVMGEITNLRVQASGHIYFTLKDAVSQIACVLFRNESRTVNRDYLSDGQKVVIDGTVTVYEARGQYQLQVFSVQLQGLGALQAAFEKLKQKLQAEGLFDQGHKRPLPRYPQRIGLITSPVGAAIRDVIHTIERRNPALRVVLAPCRVQGAGAAQEIAAAVHLLNDWAFANGEPRLDLILATRGGGSLEDLWAFNEEIVARAIYASRVPVISAVGHEIDFTISDFVADLRAATPTAAAEIMTEGAFAARPFVSEARARLRDLLNYGLHTKREQLTEALRRLARMHPRRRLGEQAQLLDELQSSVSRCLRHHLRQKQERWTALRARLVRARPNTLLARRRERLLQVSCDLRGRFELKFHRWHDRVEKSEARLRLLSPQNVLNRGYSMTLEAGTGKVVRDATELAGGTILRSKLARGEVISIVKKETGN
jgi:exodeoxyribonuclease VII large subunit